MRISDWSSDVCSSDLVSRDGRRIYFTNSLYGSWDRQFYPAGIKGWMVKLDAKPDGGIEADPDFFLEFDDAFRGHQVRLEGGDASSDSYCYSYGWYTGIDGA